MKMGQMFPSRFVTKEELAAPRTFTIHSVEMQEIEGEDGKSDKPVLLFKEKGAKPCILNKTNAEVLKDEFGPDTEDWADCAIELYVDQAIRFGGKKIGGIRVRRPLTPSVATKETDEAPF